jgi:hypothetical protein
VPPAAFGTTKRTGRDGHGQLHDPDWTKSRPAKVIWEIEKKCIGVQAWRSM